VAKTKPYKQPMGSDAQLAAPDL